ncbi:MAG: hypothetical protein E6Q88_04915 [Lysobacteraceae bacterium]|nr:MAG: hypothetical protein E6Q88_04915 [Xanthomonadaceae bacterium]
MIGTFKFSETELVAYAEKNRRDSSDACSAPTGQGSRGISTTQREEASGAMPQGRCGIVDEDDPYHDAFEYISLYCKSISKPQEQPSFRVSSPNSFNATAHHKIYRFADAPLAGSCYVCRVPKPARPPKEERKGD